MKTTILQTAQLPLAATLLLLPTIAPAELVGYWKLDGDFSDASGNGNDGTMFGGVSYTSDTAAAL